MTNEPAAESWEQDEEWAVPSEQIADLQATPVCTRCLTPVDPLQHYCHACQNAVGQFTPYIPFVSIGFEYGMLHAVWSRLWIPKHESVRRRTLYAAVFFASLFVIEGTWIILVVGAPFWWIKKRNTPAEGHCQTCGYDLRATPGRCPECGVHQSADSRS